VAQGSPLLAWASVSGLLTSCGRRFPIPSRSPVTRSVRNRINALQGFAWSAHIMLEKSLRLYLPALTPAPTPAPTPVLSVPIRVYPRLGLFLCPHQDESPPPVPTAAAQSPITAVGKLRSSQNARRHGLLARCLVLDDESPEAFRALVSQYTASLRKPPPHGLPARPAQPASAPRGVPNRIPFPDTPLSSVSICVHLWLNRVHPQSRFPSKVVTTPNSMPSRRMTRTNVAHALVSRDIPGVLRVRTYAHF
jgi:hypothetical protein